MVAFAALRVRAGLCLALLGWASQAHGEPAAASPPSGSGGAAAPPSPQPTPASAPTRHDPAGKTGVSPMMHAVARGDAAFKKGDFTAAAGAYQEAIHLAPKHALGLLRMAALHLKLGDLEQAGVMLARAEPLVGSDARLNAALLAQKAMLAESRGALEEATLAWSAYAMLGRAGMSSASADATEEAVQATAAERKVRISAALERNAASALVRRRIDQGLADAEPSNVGSTAGPAPSK